MLRAIRKSIPNKKWCFAIGTGVLIGSALGYDRYMRARVWDDQKSIALKVAQERLSPREKVRKVHIFIHNTPWAKIWFQKFIGPIFDAAALDYDLHELSEEEVGKNVKDRVINGWQGYSADPKKPFGHIPGTIADITSDEYDPDEGFIAVGSELLNSVLKGLEESHSHIKSSTLVPPSVKDNFPYPSIGFISFTDLSGWRNFPLRIKAQFISRLIAKASGDEALKIYFGNCRNLESDDLNLAFQDNSRATIISDSLLRRLVIYA